MATNNNERYEVGYGKPPKFTQFKKGHSGNPAGRPRKRPTFSDDLEAELNTTVTVTENGKPRRISKRRAMIKQQVHKAAKGSLRSAKFLVTCIVPAESQSQDVLDILLGEFQQRNRQLSIKPAAQEVPIERSGNDSSTHEGEEAPKCLR